MFPKYSALRGIMSIQVKDLAKTYRVPVSDGTFGGSLRSVFKPHYREVHAVEEISFEIRRGERVALIGPNGAGKSTTIKMLAGILLPTSGEVSVAGFNPSEQRRALSEKIGTVFGQRSQLRASLSPHDSFRLLSAIYDIEKKTFEARLSELSTAFELDTLMNKPVRSLSLGERMRCEIVASLLHGPEVLFLDEPTIGLDVAAKSAIREIILRQSRQHEQTLVFTSHDTLDIERVCDRVIIINHGKIVLDESLASVRRTFLQQKIVTVTSEEKLAPLALPGVTLSNEEGLKHSYRVDLKATAIGPVLNEISSRGSVLDVSIEDPPLEEIILKIFTELKSGSNALSI
jgi:ABC-2 type transport system ATP-binding protein